MPKSVWDKHAIKVAVYRKGKTLIDLARDNGLERSSCWVALIRRHKKGEQAIAQFLGVAAADLWPDRYVNVPRSQSAPKRKVASTTSQKSLAA